MKRLAVIFSLAIVIVSCESKNENGYPYSGIELETFKDKISYAIGADMTAQFKNIPDTIYNAMDKTELEKGYVQGFESFSVEERTTCQDKIRAIIVGPEEIDTTEYSLKDLSFCYGTMFGGMTKESLEAKNALDQFDIEMAKKGFAHGLYEIDTLIVAEERVKMITDFNNDLIKKSGEAKLSEAKAMSNAKVINDDVVLVTKSEGTSVAIIPGLEYKMFYMMQNSFGDTLMATIIDPTQPDAFNSMEIRYLDLVEGWKDASAEMKVDGKYEIYLNSPKGYGAQGIQNPNGGGYIVQPFETLILTSKVISQNEVGLLAKERGEKVIAIAASKAGSKKYPEGYIIEVLEEGTGSKVAPGSDVVAHYILSDSEGNQLENSYRSAMQNGGQAPAFSLNGVIKGWSLGVAQMRKGGKYKLYLPYDLAYGETGNRNIKPFETLTFEMEIIDFGKPGTLVKPRPMGM